MTDPTPADSRPKTSIFHLLMLLGALMMVVGFFLPFIELEVSARTGDGGMASLFGGSSPSGLDLASGFVRGVQSVLTDPNAGAAAQYLTPQASSALMELSAVAAAQVFGLVAFPLGGLLVILSYGIRRRARVGGFTLPVLVNLVVWAYAIFRISSIAASLAPKGGGSGGMGRLLADGLGNLSLDVGGGAMVMGTGLALGYIGGFLARFVEFRAARAAAAATD